MEKIGHFLKAERERKGIRLEEIASITKIHLHSLEILETGDWNRLPPEPFIRGFIIAYAKYVGVDPKEAIERYREEVNPGGGNASTLQSDGSTVVNEELTPSEILEKRQTIISKKHVAIGATAAVFLVVIGIISIGKKAAQRENASVDTPAAVVEATPVPSQAPETAQPETVSNTPAANSEPAAPPTPIGAQIPKPATETEAVAHEIVVEGKERTWIKVVTDDKPAKESFLEKGERGTYQAHSKIKVVLGNATVAKVTHNGTEVTGDKLQGTIRTFIFPPKARFPQDVPVKRAEASEPATVSEPARDSSASPSDPDSFN